MKHIAQNMIIKGRFKLTFANNYVASLPARQWQQTPTGSGYKVMRMPMFTFQFGAWCALGRSTQRKLFVPDPICWCYRIQLSSTHATLNCMVRDPHRNVISSHGTEFPLISNITLVQCGRSTLVDKSSCVTLVCDLHNRKVQIYYNGWTHRFEGFSLLSVFQWLITVLKPIMHFYLFSFDFRIYTI